MSGYKRVNFYELCRLCATNQQKDKTHIFQEEGRKIQLQTKIQSCLSLTVCENDFLPKVVCSKCLRTLEVCYTFRQECVSSESMLSSYFKNFRYTDDFKKSGKVYIKDTTTMGIATTTTTTIQKTTTIPQYQINSDNINIPTITTSTTTPASTTTTSQTTQSTIEHLPFYTLQIPTAIVATANSTTTTIKNEPKIVQSNPTTTTTTNSLNNNQPISSTIKMKNDGLSNVVVNANGEVLHIAQLVDFETIINQANIPKIKNNNNHNNSNNNNNNNKRKLKENIDEPVVKIDLTNSDIENSFDNNNKAANNNNNNIKNSKFGYTIKMEDGGNNSGKTPIILNHLHEFHQNFNGYSATIYPATTTTTTTTLEPSTVNLNVLNSDFIKTPTTTTTTTTVVTTKQELLKQQQQQQVVKMHICEICQKSFKRREHLYQHVKLHTGFRPYTCENCNKSFMRKEHLLRHMTSHSGLKNFTCNICEKSFSRNDNLLKHKKTHDKQNNYICEICQKQFVMKHYYLAHKLTHDNINNNNNNNNTTNTTTTTSHIWNVVKT